MLSKRLFLTRSLAKYFSEGCFAMRWWDGYLGHGTKPYADATKGKEDLDNLSHIKGLATWGYALRAWGGLKVAG